MAELISSATRSLFAAGGINPWPNPYHHEDMGCGGMTPTGECFSTEWWCDPSYGLSDAGYGYCFVEATGGYLVVGVEKKQAWLHSRGTPGEKIGAQVCQWIAFSIAIALLTFYGFSAWKATCGWEEVYVCCVEVLFVTLEIFKEFSSPATVYLSTGNHAYCLRYFEWLLSCPVILIKLSNLSGLKNDYSKRTMGLIVSCVGMIVFGMAAGLATDWLKWLLYIVSCIYGGYMYFQAAKCYVEANHSVPKGHCRMVVKLMAYAYFASWGSYPILWAVGPEGLLKLSPYANSIGHSICDIIAKEFWTFLAHHLRIKIHEHILIHGDIRKTTKMEIGGEEVEVEEFVEEEDEDTV
nr:Chrimson [synthetic construct]